MTSAPDGGDDDRAAITRTILRTGLLAASAIVLFPQLLDVPTHGAWKEFVLSLGIWRWVAWGVIFAVMTVMRFAGGPKRR